MLFQLLIVSMGPLAAAANKRPIYEKGAVKSSDKAAGKHRLIGDNTGSKRSRDISTTFIAVLNRGI